MKLKCMLLSIGIVALVASTLRADDGLKSVVEKKPSASPTLESGGEWKKPDWLTELSLTFRESYDSNVYYSNVPPLANQDSMVSTISPKFDINFVPLLDAKDVGMEKLTLSYNPVISYYHAETGENNTAHNIGNQIKGKADDFSYDLTSLLTVVDGSNVALAFPNGYNTISANAQTRNRRAQTDEVGKLSLRYELNDKWFVRTVAQTLYQDFSTRFMSTAAVPGYLNYIDRYDVNVGPDIGYKAYKDFAVALGYRAGHQGQSVFASNNQNSATQAGGSNNNNYQRVLVGLEGAPWKWLKLDVSAGPDFRHYGNDIPVKEDRNFNRIYSDSKITFLPTAEDTITLLIRQSQWLSSTSISTCEDETFRFGYKRQWTKDFSAEVFAQLSDSNYDSNPAIATANRDDNVATFGLNLVYKLNKNITFDLGYQAERGGSAYMPNSPICNAGRDYTRHLVGFGTKYSF
jgi:hypothetical protein